MKTREEKRAEAQERQVGYSSLTAEERITKLDRMFGKGKGAAKERAKIAASASKVAVSTKKSKRKKNEKTEEESN